MRGLSNRLTWRLPLARLVALKLAEEQLVNQERGAIGDKTPIAHSVWALPGQNESLYQAHAALEPMNATAIYTALVWHAERRSGACGFN
jgi:hypothetical protein